GCARAHPMPRPERHRSVGVRRLRLLRPPRSAPRHARRSLCRRSATRPALSTARPVVYTLPECPRLPCRPCSCARERRSSGAEAPHVSRGIGLAHYELGQCYRQVGDVAIVREHISKAASALHAAGDRRHLALVHSLSSISLAQLGRYDEGMAALRQAERLAAMVQADDVLATVCGNQANVMMLQHRYEQALALAERSVA